MRIYNILIFKATLFFIFIINMLDKTEEKKSSSAAEVITQKTLKEFGDLPK